MQPLLVRNLQIPHVHLLVRNQAMTVGRQTCLHPGHCRSLLFSHGLWCGVSGRCSSMSWSLPRPLTESGPLLNQSKYSAPRQCTRSFISWTLKHLCTNLWRCHHSRHHRMGELDGVIAEGGPSSRREVNNVPATHQLCVGTEGESLSSLTPRPHTYSGNRRRGDLNAF